jgi:MFS family permease
MLIAHKGWRLMMMLGTLPAVLTFLIRMFVPESKKWEHEQGKGTTSHWATQDLLAVLVGMVGPFMLVYVWAVDATAGIHHSAGLRVVATVLGLLIATVGYTYPVIRFFQRQAAANPAMGNWQPTLRLMLLAACLSGVALLGTWGSTQWAATYADKLAESERLSAVKQLEAAGQTSEDAVAAVPHLRAREWTQIWLAVGAIVGTLLAAMMGDWMGRRRAYCLLCVLSLVSVYILFLGHQRYTNGFLFWAFIAGTMTASFYGWLPLYLPELFRTSVRATGQGFGYNFGRILAAIGVLQTGNLMSLFTQDVHFGPLTIPQGYPLACSTMSLIYLVGMVLIWFAPETRGKPLPE